MKKIFLLLLIIIAFLSGQELFNILNEYKINEYYYKEIQKTYSKNITKNDTILENLFNAEKSEGNDQNVDNTNYNKQIKPHQTKLKPPISVNFKALKETNEEVIGWIYSKDTVIDYPILHSLNNNKYIHRLLNGKYSANGSIFLDSICNDLFTDDNSILYGHHMRDGSMFASLKKYQNQDYYNNHSMLWLLTPSQNYLLIPFSAMVVPSNSKFYNNVINNKQDFINKAIEKSLFIPKEIPNIKDRIITLSTCDYTYNNARFIVMCILIPVFNN